MTPTVQSLMHRLTVEDRLEWERVIANARGDLARAEEMGDPELLEFCQGRLARLTAVPQR